MHVASGLAGPLRMCPVSRHVRKNLVIVYLVAIIVAILRSQSCGMKDFMRNIISEDHMTDRNEASQQPELVIFLIAEPKEVHSQPL